MNNLRYEQLKLFAIPDALIVIIMTLFATHGYTVHGLKKTCYFRPGLYIKTHEIEPIKNSQDRIGLQLGGQTTSITLARDRRERPYLYCTICTGFCMWEKWHEWH